MQLQEELQIVTSREEGAASWVAERALNRELTAANHELEGLLSELQRRLLGSEAGSGEGVVRAVLQDRESRREARVLREQVMALQGFLALPLTDRPRPEAPVEGPATEEQQGRRSQDRSSKKKKLIAAAATPSENLHRQKLQKAGGASGGKLMMTREDALQVVLDELGHLRAQCAGLKADSARRGAEVRLRMLSYASYIFDIVTLVPVAG